MMNYKLILMGGFFFLMACHGPKIESTEQASALRHMGDITAKQGNFDHAVELYAKAEKMDPKHPINPLFMAKIQMRSTQYDLAIRTYKTILKNYPNRLEAKQGLAKAYFLSGQIPKSLLLWESIFKAKSSDSTALNGLGLVMAGLNHQALSLACFKKGLKTQPNDRVLLNNEALSLAIAGDIPKAIKQLTRAQDIQVSARQSNNLALLKKAKNHQLPEWKEKIAANFPKFKNKISHHEDLIARKMAIKWCGS